MECLIVSGVKKGPLPFCSPIKSQQTPKLVVRLGQFGLDWPIKVAREVQNGRHLYLQVFSSTNNSLLIKSDVYLFIFPSIYLQT
jgi:hypothetical protein